MSTIKTETLSSPSNATVPVDTVVNGTAKAWVNFNGTGTVAIRRAFNVASITDNGTGSYTVNFTTAMVDSDICVIGSTGESQISGIIRVGGSNATLAAINSRISNTAAAYDDAKIYIAIFS